MTVQDAWIFDVLPGFKQTTLAGFSASDGTVEVVPVRRRCSVLSNKGVLYIHGYMDYFFQTHLSNIYNHGCLHSYAIKLRRHRRSMRQNRFPNYTCNIDEYQQDIDGAFAVLREAVHTRRHKRSTAQRGRGAEGELPS